jgi:hypothetical protein
VLNDPSDDRAVSLYYGLKAGHGHFDRLAIDLFANHEPMLPDLGYPDAMNDFVAGIYAWSKNTIAHNTVTVDAARQPGNLPGTLHLFADSPLARVIDVDGNGTYPQCSQYRRAVVMVDVDSRHSYFVDFFTVVGGKQHDYSLHGPPGKFQMVGGDWSSPAPGTLAGEKISLGEIYDNPAMAAPGYSGGYSSYAGSGFQYLFNVQHLNGGSFVAQWQHERADNARLRVRLFDQPGKQVFACDAHVSPAKYPQIVKYLIARTQGESLSSQFVSVIEPYDTEPFIRAATLHRDGASTRVDVDCAGGKDSIEYRSDGPSGSEVTVVRRDSTGARSAEFSAGHQSVSGEVVSIDREKSIVRVRLRTDVDPNTLNGRVAFFQNGLHRTAYPITAVAENSGLVELTTRDDLVVGRIKVDAIEALAVSTVTALPLGPIYRGTFLCADGGSAYHPVRSAGAGKIVLTGPLAPDQLLAPGKDAWLTDVGPGDKFDMPSSEFWHKPD